MFQNFDQGIFRGIAAYAKDSQRWSLYVEQEQFVALSAIDELDTRGLIVNLDSRLFVRASKRLKVPTVGFGGSESFYDPLRGHPFVTTDNVAIGRMAAQHLLEAGFRHFAYCGFKPTRQHLWTIGREEGFRSRLAESGFDCEVFTGSYSQGVHSGDSQKEIAAWLKRIPKPIGIMGCYDWRARHIMEACSHLGLHIPDDVALIGVDNDLMLCDLTDPPLTSIEQGRLQIGHTAAELLDQMIRGRKVKPEVHRIAPVGVVVRQSTNWVATPDPVISQALRLIRDEACHGLTADDVAVRMRVSRTTLDNHMKASVGRTADLEIRRVRLAKVEELLLRSNLKLKEISTQAGFSNEQYLCSVWKRTKRMTPNQFRQKHRLSQY